jgi:transmembrane sensor
MDEIIDRERRGEATPVELQQLSEWRRASLANEHEYRRTVALLDAARSLASPRSTPPSAADLLARRRSGEHRLSRRTAWVPWLIAAAAAASLVASMVLRRPPAPPPSWGVANVATGAAEMTTVQLGDGSVVRLAPESHLRVIASDSAREVSLDGRAFFVVAKMAGRPFVVHTSAGSARVLGTRFELSTHDRDLSLVVVEGRVALSGADRTVEVHGGEQSGVRDRKTLSATRVVNAEALERWVGKFLAFQSTTVRDAAREIEQMYGIHVAIADSIVGARTVTATFTDQTSAKVLDVVCTIVNARCDSRIDTVVVSRR